MNRLAETLSQRLAPWLDPQARALVAVSGGRDSVALLHALVSGGWRRLIVCHFNHRLRGRASGGDARFVAALARRFGLELESGAEEVAALAARQRLSLEAAARQARYGFFASVARRRRTQTLLLGHHAGDQVETVLFNLLRGTGLTGLGGIASQRELAITPPGGRTPVRLRLLRPMLTIPRAEIDAYVAEHRLRFREDASNATVGYTRNAVRHQLLPLAKEIMGREVEGAILRLAESARAEEAWLQSLLPAPEEGSLPLPSLRADPLARQRRRLQRWMSAAGVPSIGWREVELVRSLLEVERPAKVNLPGGWHARRRGGLLFLEPPA